MHIKNPFHTINAIIFIMFNRTECCKRNEWKKIENDIDQNLIFYEIGIKREGNTKSRPLEM